MFTYPIRKQRINRFLGQGHAIRLATQVRKFDKRDGIVLRVEDQGSDLQNALPDFDVRLATLQSSHIFNAEVATKIKTTYRFIQVFRIIC
jgi:hypothetical protein